MSVEGKFYLLIIDEIRQQPGLRDELPGVDLERFAARFAGRPLDEALTLLAGRQALAGGAGFAALAELGAEPAALTRELDEQRAAKPNAEAITPLYESLCRAALLSLLWKDLARAETKINLAKYLRDEWAFAHYLYGLLRGVDGELGKAHFELYLAVNRETFGGAKTRIERALSLVR